MSNVRMAFDGGRTRSPIADALATGPRVLKIWLNNRLLNKGYCPKFVSASIPFSLYVSGTRIETPKETLEKVCNAQHTECRIFCAGYYYKEYTILYTALSAPKIKY